MESERSPDPPGGAGTGLVTPGVAPGPNGEGVPAAPTNGAPGPPEGAPPDENPALIANRGLFRLVAPAGVAVALVVGAGLRCWFLFHLPLNADEAVVGLNARAILEGHLTAFYPGQAYGGAEPYVVAAMFALFGQSAFVVKMTAVVLSAVSAVLTWRIARRLVRDPMLAALAGALVWATPLAVLLNSTVERGFRGVTMVCGLGAVLAALRLLDRARPPFDVVVLGLLAGVGWWSSPEASYLLVPAAILAVAAMVAERGPRWWAAWWRRLVALVGGFVVGAAPWLWANAASGGASLRTSSFGGAASPANSGYGDRLGVFFAHALPMSLDLVAPDPTGRLLGGPLGTPLAVAVYAATAAALALCVARGGRVLALVAGVLVFPVLYAAQPATWYWNDGRYVVFLVPMLTLVLVTGVEEAVRRLRGHGTLAQRVLAGRAVLVGVVVATALLSGVALRQAAFALDARTRTGLLTHWGRTEGPTERAVGKLERAGIRYAYADYWEAYPVEFLSGDRIEVATLPTEPPKPIPGLRAPAGVRRAWLFVPPAQIVVGLWQFGETPRVVGPLGMKESTFEARLAAQGIGYRVVHAGVLDAVVPARPVAPSAVGLP